MVHCTAAAQSFSLPAMMTAKWCCTARFRTVTGDGAHVSGAGFSKQKTPGYTTFNPFVTKEAPP